MHKDAPPPYSKVPEATPAKKPFAKKPLVDRLLARFGLYRGAPQSQSYSLRDAPAPRLRAAPVQRRGEATHMPTVEAEPSSSRPKSEASPESEPEPKVECALKQCRRCLRLFYHPIMASHPY